MELWFKRAKTGWLSKLVSFRTIGPFSHVEAIIGQWAWSAVPGAGIRRIPVHNLNRDDYERIRITGLDDAVVKEWFKKHEGETYDVVGIIEFAAGKPGGDPRAWSCAEACCAAMQADGAFRSIPSYMVFPTLLWAMALAREDALKEVVE